MSLASMALGRWRAPATLHAPSPTGEGRIRARFDIRYPDFTLTTELDLPGRGVTALFGHSGSGKTTCLRAIAGLERHAAGYLEVNGEIWQDESRGHFVPTYQRSLGYVFQEASLFPHLSVLDNLEFGRRRIPAQERRVPLEQAVELLGISHLLERRPGHLSGGERQRVAIARALLTSPRLLLMDEPLAALDLKRKSEILPYLEKLHDELDIPILYVSHSPDEVARLADHLVLLERGKVLASGRLDDTLCRLDLPMSRNEDAAVVIEGQVSSLDTEYGLAELAFTGGCIWVAHDDARPGRRLRFQVRAKDVSVARTRLEDSSILNILPARILDEAEADTPAHVLIRADAGGTPILARITRRSRDLLALRPGQDVWLQIKAVAVLA